MDTVLQTAYLLFQLQTVIVECFQPTAIMDTKQSPINVRWSHATNTGAKLRDALQSDAVDFIEADVLLGSVTGHESSTNIPIMAHPPDTTSDISFRDWIELIKESNTTKGIKIDFKDFRAVESCLSDISRTTSMPLRQEVWLNADVLVGPGEPMGTPPIPAEEFVDICTKNGPPGHVLSIGWTTKAAKTPEEATSLYSWANIFQMVRLLDKVPQHTAVTFPVRLSHLVFAPLSLLLDLKNGSTLTVWSHATDLSPRFDVMELLMRAYPDRIYADLPDEHLQRVMDIQKDMDNITPPATLKVSSWKATDSSESGLAPWGGPYAIVVPGPGSITVEVTDPLQLKWVGISGDLIQAAGDSKDPTNEEARTPTEENRCSSKVTLTFVGSGETVLFLKQPISKTSK